MPLIKDIAGLVSSGLQGAGMTLPATLIKVTPGTRTPGAISAGTHPTTTSFAVQGVPGSTQQLAINGTLIQGVDRVIKLLGATLPASVTPTSGDRIAMDGATSTIVDKGVSVDAAGAAYVCQCRS